MDDTSLPPLIDPSVEHLERRSPVPEAFHFLDYRLQSRVQFHVDSTGAPTSKPFRTLHAAASAKARPTQVAEASLRILQFAALADFAFDIVIGQNRPDTIILNVEPLGHIHRKCWIDKRIPRAPAV